jgi:hypothetical protein
MAQSDIIQVLEGIKNAKRIYRDRAANDVLDHPELLPDLIGQVYEVSSPLHIKAAWVLELVCLANISLMTDYASRFIEQMHLISNESALRPVSKVCCFLSRHYFSTNKSSFYLAQKSVDQIIECNFDWLIEEHKVATQVFAMDTLEIWGKEYEWVRDELRQILQKKTASGSRGYQAHARKLLKNL